MYGSDLRLQTVKHAQQEDRDLAARHRLAGEGRTWGHRLRWTSPRGRFQLVRLRAGSRPTAGRQSVESVRSARAARLVG